jgi:predicted nucleotidyltransferase
MSSLVAQVLGIAHALDEAGIEWALGGALALAYATEEPRGTRDIDVNVFVSASEVRRVFVALPDGVTASTSDEARVLAEDQVRLWWDGTPIDLFFAAGPFHAEVANRIRRVPFAGHEVKVLCAEDLAVFKAMFDRPKDWVDIDEMATSGALDRTVAAQRLEHLLGSVDPRVWRLATGAYLA